MTDGTFLGGEEAGVQEGDVQGANVLTPNRTTDRTTQ